MGATVDGTAQASPKQKPKGPREKTLPLSPHGHTARFLYLMLKQVDLKQINWQDVADGTGISKESAAKLRYSRFKKQIGSQIMGDAIQVKKEKERDVKEEKGLAEGSDDSVGRERSAAKRGRERGRDAETEMEARKRIKLENATPIKQEYRRFSSIVSIDDDDDEEDDDTDILMTPNLPQSPFIKPEPGTSHVNPTTPNFLSRSPFIKSEYIAGYCSPSLPTRQDPANTTNNTQPDKPSTPRSKRYNPTDQRRKNMSNSPATPTRASPSAVLQPRSNYRSPWAVFESEEEQQVLSPSAHGHGRRVSVREDGKGKGSAREPFSID